MLKGEGKAAQEEELLSAVELAYSQYLPEEEWNKESSPLVILHCLCGSRRDWHTLSEKLAKLLKREVLTIDLRNHGESGHAPSMQYKEMVHDVITHLDKLNIAKAHFLGSSMGASVMMTLALFHPHRVHSLISEDTIPCKIISLKSIIRGYLEVLASLDMSLPDGSLENLKERALPELEKVEQSRNISLFFTRNIVVSKEDSNTATCTFNLQAILKDLDHLTSWDETLAGRQFTGPVCFLGGSDSINQPTGELSEEQKAALTSYFPSAEIHMIQNAGHLIHRKQPEKFMEHVCRFIDSL